MQARDIRTKDDIREWWAQATKDQKRAVARQVAEDWREQADTADEWFALLVGESKPPSVLVDLPPESAAEELWGSVCCEDEECATEFWTNVADRLR